MKLKKEIEQGLKEMETRKKGYLLDMAEKINPQSLVYNTEIIRKLEVTDAIIHALRWVLLPKKQLTKQKGK